MRASNTRMLPTAIAPTTPHQPNTTATIFATVSLALVFQLGLPMGRAAAEEIVPDAPRAAATAPAISRNAMDRFLDRLTIVESGGRETAKNPRSSALGPFQFITSTFLELARRHFQPETFGMQPAKVLALRTDRAFSRRAAEAYTLECAAVLNARNIAATPANLRLAYLLGPGSAVRVLEANANTPVVSVVGSSVVRANPFMKGMTAADLSRWSERNMAGRSTPVSTPVIEVAGTAVPTPQAQQAQQDRSFEPSTPNSLAPSESSRRASVGTVRHRGFAVASKPACRISLASCRRWIALNSGVKPPVAAAKQMRKVAAKRPAPARNRIVHASGRGRAA